MPQVAMDDDYNHGRYDKSMQIDECEVNKYEMLHMELNADKY